MIYVKLQFVMVILLSIYIKFDYKSSLDDLL